MRKPNSRFCEVLRVFSLFFVAWIAAPILPPPWRDAIMGLVNTGVGVIQSLSAGGQ